VIEPRRENDEARKTNDERTTKHFQPIPLVILFALNKGLASLFMPDSGTTTETGVTDPGYNDQAQFDRLQEKLVPLWKSIECFNQDPQTIVVVPSMSIDPLGGGAVMQAY